MNKLFKVGLPVVTAALVIGLSGGAAMAKDGGSSGTWPAAYPLPLDPGTLISQTSTTAVVRSTDFVFDVETKLDDLYVTQKGCASVGAVNKPRNYFCFNPETRKTDEIYFTFAALDPTATDPSRSQSNAFYLKG